MNKWLNHAAASGMIIEFSLIQIDKRWNDETGNSHISHNCSGSWIFIHLTFDNSGKRNGWWGSESVTFCPSGPGWGLESWKCVSGMKGWWSVIVGEWVELYLCWTGCPWFCWLSGYIQTGTWQQACNTRPSQPTKDAKQETNKKKQKSIRKKYGSMTKKRHTLSVKQIKSLSQMKSCQTWSTWIPENFFFSVNEAFRRWWPPIKSRQIDGIWQWCPREAKPRLRGHHCLDRYLPLNWKGICVANIKQPGLSNPGLINSINATHQSKWASSCQQCHQSRLMVKPARDSALFTSDNLPKDIK